MFGPIIAVAAAQQQPDELARDAAESPFLQSAAKELDAFATLAWKNHFPRRAREVWLEVISEYDRDDAVAREALGFVRVGTAWQPKPGFEFPKADELDAGNAKAVETRWSAVCKKLGDGHRDLAGQLQTAGNQERARYHFQRSLRFQPMDTKAQTGLGAKTVEGVTGTELELELLRRSRLMERLITKLTDQVYEVKATDLKEPRLDQAKVPYSAYQSDHFVIFGDWEPEVLIEAGQWAERSLAFCEQVFDGYQPWAQKPTLTPRIAFFKQRATWADVVRANGSAAGDVEFIVTNTSSCNIGSGKTGLYLSGIENSATVFDFSVRKVAQEYSKLSRDALVEGIGHAVTGMFFGRNLLVMVAQQKKEGTSTGKDKSRYELPDMETWKDLARELAFEKGTAPAAHLPLITAAKFTVEERLKAWSFCDYLLRRDPTLMLDLERAAFAAKNDFDVMAAFLDKTKVPLLGIEEDWRVFYTGDSAALTAIRNKVTPMQAVSKEAPAWIDELNRQRKLHGAREVVWSADLSAACRQHADYLKLNKGERGPDKENTQVPGKPGFSNTGRLFAATAAIAARDKDPKKAMEAWWLLPGYRDVLLDRGLETVGAYAEGALCVFEVVRGRASKSFNETVSFPYANVEGRRHKDLLPGAVDVELVGPELRALLQKNGQGKQKQVGLPLSMHLFGADQSDVKCEVRAGTEAVAGVLVHATEGSRRVAAPGLWVFWPFAPLKKGVDITVTWTVNGRAETVTFGCQ